MAAGGGVLQTELDPNVGDSLRAKSLAFFAVLLAHLACVAVLMMIERANLLSEVSALGHLHAAVEALVQGEVRFGSDGGRNEGERVGARRVQAEPLAVTTFSAGGERLEAPPSLLSDPVVLVAHRYADAADEEAMKLTGSAHAQLAPRVDAAITDLRERRSLIEHDLKWRADLTLGLVLAIELLTIAAVTAAVLVFVRRISSDLLILTLRAREIGRGAAGGEICITRRDELGQLARAVEGIRGTWLARERDLEWQRMRQSHRHTLDVLGALAQKMAHEIGNPLAGIVGVAQAIDEAKQVKRCRSNGTTCHPQVILEQAARIVGTSRQFADWSNLQRGDAGAVNVNDLIERTCSLLAFDRRLSAIRIRTSLAAALPAVDAAGDDIVQLLTWCLIDAAQRAPAWVEVVSGRSDSGVQLLVSDDGEAFSYPAGAQVTHCASGEGGIHAPFRLLVEEMRGQVEIFRDNGVNVVRFCLPLAPLSQHGGHR